MSTYRPNHSNPPRRERILNLAEFRIAETAETLPAASDMPMERESSAEEGSPSVKAEAGA